MPRIIIPLCVALGHAQFHLTYLMGGVLRENHPSQIPDDRSIIGNLSGLELIRICNKYARVKNKEISPNSRNRSGTVAINTMTKATI